jgi:hypothetical protein
MDGIQWTFGDKDCTQPELTRINCSTGASGVWITVKQAMEQFVQHYEPALKIRIAPLWVIRVLGLFGPRIEFVGHLFAYFGSHEDPFYADQTWRDLGKPKTSVEMFARGLRQSPTAR